MATKTQIANLALQHLGISAEIANLDAEDELSVEATVMRRFYDVNRQATLRDFKWPFATSFLVLAQIAETPAENPDWQFSYRMPSKAIFFRRIVSGILRESRQDKIPYIIARGEAGDIIYTNQDDARGEFTFDETETGRFPPDFVKALSRRLAFDAAPSLLKGEFHAQQQIQWENYINALRTARSNAGNEEQLFEEPDAEMIRVRGAGGTFLPPSQGGGAPFGT